MSTLTNRARVEQFVQAFRDRDGAAQLALMHPDIVIHEPEGLPYGGLYRGHAGWRALNKAILSAWDQLDLRVDYVLGEADGERFAVKAHMAGVSRRTGQRFECDVLELWTLRDGAIVELRPFYWDSRRLAEINGDIATPAQVS